MPSPAFAGGGGGGYNAQAQLVINVYPSQDNPTSETLWIFRGTGTTLSGTIRTSGNSHADDTWEISGNNGNIYNANRPSNQLLTLSSLFSSSNAKDIASVNARIPGGGKTNITFAASATNAPTITIDSGSRTISQIFMHDDPGGGIGGADNIGIRVSGSNLGYSSGNASAWVGSGILNKPIGDFFAGTYRDLFNGPNFAGSGSNNIRLTINSQIIPEPQEYAIVFGLFALGFVFFHRRFQKKRQASSSS